MRLQQKYHEQVIPELQKELGIKNQMAVPRLKKVVIGMGLGAALQDKSLIEKASQDLMTITGQKPLITKAMKSVATFKLRQGDPIGVKATLRGQRMYDFVEKLFNIVIPRFRDFRGLSPKHFDGQGNYTVGMKEQIVFPEIDYAKIDKIRGLEITFVTSADSNDTAKALLTKLGMPFEK